MSNRTAISTIKGYFYQFDLSIYKILTLSNDNDKIIIEGIEDIDIESKSKSEVIQCKYYEKTEYNHSIIAKPIRLMLDHFKKIKKDNKPKINYHLYGHYNSGQEKLSSPINLKFLKDKILTYKKNEVTVKHHEELGLSDTDLQEFINLLLIDINANSYDDQFEDILSILMKKYSCNKFEAEFCFYNNALNEIRKIAIESDIKKRKISKEDFLKRIDKKEFLFNQWFLELKGEKEYLKEIKNNYFKPLLNRHPFERFFLIDLPNSYDIIYLKDLIFVISKKYSKLSKREPQKFCPYIFFNNIKEKDLISIKKQLYQEGFIFSDGYPFLGSDFSPKTISKMADEHNKIKVKILGKIDEINNSLDYITKTKEVYQFYFSTPFYTNANNKAKYINIQINKLENIKEII
ncbi:MAG: hypothetical protein KGV59_05070 [Tenacibaculum sp.]|nr:hypothetical protein [Tenacibaculum sp.]